MICEVGFVNIVFAVIGPSALLQGRGNTTPVRLRFSIFRVIDLSEFIIQGIEQPDIGILNVRT